MKKLLVFLLLFICVAPFSKAQGAYDPLSVPNNKIGIHILFTSELPDAAKLINSNGGDWGYVTIPIQAGDKNLQKWQGFMDQAKQLHIIPIIRLASEGDYFNPSSWRKISFSDILDFSNFLNSLTWPTKNRYVIVGNEPNNGTEWGGTPSPTEYAQILSYAVTAFKSKNPDFFIISAGLDNAAANTSFSINEYTFLSQMQTAIPGIFNQIDGIASHAYPNPAFSQPPQDQNNESIASFRYESDLISTYTSKKLPIFITETGWSANVVSDGLIAQYYPVAFNTVWNDNRIVTVTPFLLSANAGPFLNFSLLKNGAQTPEYMALFNLPKIKGLPQLAPKVLAAESVDKPVPTEKFVEQSPTLFQTLALQVSKVVGKFLLGIN